MTDGIENILRNIVFGNLASYPRPRRGVELAQEYTTDGTLLSTSLVVLRVAVHHVRSQFFTHQECLTHKFTKITDPTHFTHRTNQLSVIPIHETIKIFALWFYRVSKTQVHNHTRRGIWQTDHWHNFLSRMKSEFSDFLSLFSLLSLFGSQNGLRRGLGTNQTSTWFAVCCLFDSLKEVWKNY